MQSALVTIYQLIRQHIHLIKRFSFLLLSSITLTACGSTQIEGVSVGGEDYYTVIKNTPIFKKCKPAYSHYESKESDYFFGVRCSFENTAPPDSFEIVYAVWPNDDIDFERFFGEEVWRYEPGESNIYTSADGKRVSKEEWMKLGNENLNKAIAQLPASAWQTYTVDVKSTLKKYEGKTPEGNPMGIAIPIGWGIYYPSLFPSLQDRIIQFNLLIDKEGNVKLKEEYRWENELQGNPYS